MHRSLFLILFLLPFYGSGQERTAALFIKANKEYAEKRYEAAIGSYQQVLDAGTTTTAVYYNLGNAYFRLNNFEKAVSNYEQAFRLTPNDKDVKANLALARSKITGKAEIVPELFLKRWWISFLLLITVQGWSVLGVVLLSIGFSGLIVYLFARDYDFKRMSFYVGLILILFGLCCVLFAGAQQEYLAFL